MKKIEIYDIESDRIDELCEKYDTTPAELIETLFDILDDLPKGEESITEYL